MSSKSEIAELRKLVKSYCPTVSVRMGRGTAYGWTDISGSAKWGNFTPSELKCLKGLGMTPGMNFEVISPEDRKYWISKLSSKGKPWSKRAERDYG